MKKAIQEHFNGRWQEAYRPYVKKLKKAGKGYQGLCCFHPDKNPSLSIDPDTGRWYCHACGEGRDFFDFYARVHGLNAERDFPSILDGIAKEFSIACADRHETQKKKLVKTYDYQDETGALQHQSCRYEPKEFSFRRPDGHGGWINDLKGVRRVIYNLPEVYKAVEVLIVEGEKDVETLRRLGFAATCNRGGARNWKPEDSEYLRDKKAVVFADNDEPGREHQQTVAQSIYGIAAEVRTIPPFSQLPKGGDISDELAGLSEDYARERVSIILAEAQLWQPDAKAESEGEADPFQLINAAKWLNEESPFPDQVLEDTFDTGDKVAIIGLSKLRKSFFLLQLAILLAAGLNFLLWKVSRCRRVLYVQLEIQEHHFHKRLKRMCTALGITAEKLGDRLQILNGRGLGITGPEGVERIEKLAQQFKPEVIVFDPLYKIASGVENAAEDMKKVMDSFDTLTRNTGAAVIYVHHDAKGSPGERDIRDRGAGSNVLGRDYDACLTLTGHATEEDAVVVEVLLRNYRPQEAQTIAWTEDEETGGYRFEVREDIAPEKKTSKTKSAPLPLSSYWPVAKFILNDGWMEIAQFKEAFKLKTGLSNKRIGEFLAWATAGGNPYMQEKEERGRGNHKKWVRANEGK